MAIAVAGRNDGEHDCDHGHAASLSLDNSASNAAGHPATPAARMIVAVVLLFSLAAILRLGWLGRGGLWIDEAATAGFAALPWADLAGPIALLETTPPTYYGILRVWTWFAGASDCALRAFSAVCGVMSIGAFGIHCRRAFGPGTALPAMLLLAVSAWHVVYSREARVYALTLLLFVVGLILAHRLADALSRRDRAPWAKAAMLASVAGLQMLLHYVQVVPAASLFVYVLVLLGARNSLTVKNISIILVTGIASLLVASPAFAAAFFLARDPSNAASWMTSGTPADALSIPVMVTFYPPLSTLLYLGLPIAMVAGLASIGATTLLLARGVYSASPANWAHTAVIVFSILSFLFAAFIHPLVLPRTAIFLIVPAVALVASGLHATARTATRIVTLTLIILPHLASSMGVIAGRFQDEDWPALAATLHA